MYIIERTTFNYSDIEEEMKINYKFVIIFLKTVQNVLMDNVKL